MKYDYLASLQSVHYEDCIEVNYHLDSTEDPGKLIEVRVRTARPRRRREVPSVVSVWEGADFQEREVYDMVGVRFTGHPNLNRILIAGRCRLLPAQEGLPRTLLRRPVEGLRQPGRGGLRPAFPGRGVQPPRHESRRSRRATTTGPSSPPTTTRRGRTRSPGASTSPN
ncbi:MAG: NADH-quinone oxidoreductase subunit C [Isosphaeraceae bacterium]